MIKTNVLNPYPHPSFGNIFFSFPQVDVPIKEMEGVGKH